MDKMDKMEPCLERPSVGHREGSVSTPGEAFDHSRKLHGGPDERYAERLAAAHGQRKLGERTFGGGQTGESDQSRATSRTSSLFSFDLAQLRLNGW